MKRKCLNVMGLLMMTVFLSAIAIACGKDEKDPEVVPDPMEDLEEYFIAGAVYDNATSTPLADVTVTMDDQNVKTAADGTYSMLVSEKKAYKVSFSKEKYIEVSTSADVANNAKNRSMVTLSVKLSAKSEPVNVECTGGVVCDKESEEKSSTTVTVPAGAVPEGQTATMSITPYEEPTSASTNTSTGTASESVALASIAIESTVTKFEEPVKITLRNVASSKVYFNDVTVWASPATNSATLQNNSVTAQSRAGVGWTSQGKAVVSEGNYSFDTKELRPKYSLEVNCSIQTGSIQTGEVNKVNGLDEVKVDNSGKLTAIKDFKLTVLVKTGWEFTTTPTQALQTAGVSATDLTQMAATIQHIIETQEGGTAHTYTVENVLTTSISGNHIMYYKNQARYCERTFTFNLVIDGQNKTATVKVKKYTGALETYSNVEYGHSGGLIQ